jgi:hypothetical protein
MARVPPGNTAELWREPGLGRNASGELDEDDEDAHDHADDYADDHAEQLRTAKLISAAMIAKVLDSPCAKCVRAKQEGTDRHDCRTLGCDRWSTRRARRWLRRSQCVQQHGDPPCPARTGGRCHCQVGFRLAAGGPWCTTMARLRDRFPDLLDLVLVAQADED